MNQDEHWGKQKANRDAWVVLGYIFLPNSKSMESIIYGYRHILEEPKDYRRLFQTARTLHKTVR